MPTLSKTPYALDPVSLERLASLAHRWQVSKTEALRRALARAEESDMPTAAERIAALHELQRRTKESGVDLEKWQQTIRDARR